MATEKSQIAVSAIDFTHISRFYAVRSAVVASGNAAAVTWQSQRLIVERAAPTDNFASGDGWQCRVIR